jgi:hypothetical protein
MRMILKQAGLGLLVGTLVLGFAFDANAGGRHTGGGSYHAGPASYSHPQASPASYSHPGYAHPMHGYPPHAPAMRGYMSRGAFHDTHFAGMHRYHQYGHQYGARAALGRGAGLGYGIGAGYGDSGYAAGGYSEYAEGYNAPLPMEQTGNYAAPIYNVPPSDQPQTYSRSYAVPLTVYQPVTRTYTVPVLTYQTYQRTEQVPVTVYRRVVKTCTCSYGQE